jgi:predicted alpha/beta hydrolase family esterase
MLIQFFIVQIVIVFSAFIAFAGDTQLEFSNVSQLPVHAYEQVGAKANMIAIIGGKGIKNKEGKSKNFLVTQKSIFTNLKLNYYLFPNWSNSKKATYEVRVSRERIDRILNLVTGIRNRNSLPIYLVGFSRGSVDAATFAKVYPKKIKGIVLSSGIYKNSSRKAKFYSMERLIGPNIAVAVLVAHHKNDSCKVTQFRYAKAFYENLNAPRKRAIIVDGGVPTGRKCGPFHHHGFENIEGDVAEGIAKWLVSDAVE